MNPSVINTDINAHNNNNNNNNNRNTDDDAIIAAANAIIARRNASSFSSSSTLSLSLSSPLFSSPPPSHTSLRSSFLYRIPTLTPIKFDEKKIGSYKKWKSEVIIHLKSNQLYSHISRPQPSTIRVIDSRKSFHSLQQEDEAYSSSTTVDYERYVHENDMEYANRIKREQTAFAVANDPMVLYNTQLYSISYQFLYNCLSFDLQTLYEDYITTYDLFKNLNDKFAPTDAIALAAIRLAFETDKLKSGENADVFYMRLIRHRSLIQEMNGSCTSEDLEAKFLSSLTPDLTSTVTNLRYLGTAFLTVVERLTTHQKAV